MANGFFPLVAPNAGGGLNFEPISNALTDLQTNRFRQQQMDLQQRNALMDQQRWQAENARADETQGWQRQNQTNALMDRGWKIPLEQQKGAAEIGKLQRDAAGLGGETPANVREWNTYSRMSPEQQQQYLTMKRANKFLDVGDSFLAPNPTNAAAPPVASVPKNLAAAEAAKARGEGQGKAQVDLPRVETNANRMLRQIDAVKQSDLGRVTGYMGQLPTIRPESVDVEEKAGQLSGGAFLQAFESLKGGGQITEIEGSKATAALARLQNFKQSEKGYRDALKDFEFEVRELVALARARAGKTAAPQDGEAPTPDNDGWVDMGGVRIREKR